MNAAAPSSPVPTDVEARIHRIYDHLYANGHVRTPGGIGEEVGKLLHAGLFNEEVRGREVAFQVSRADERSVMDGGTHVIAALAAAVRDCFAEMNSAWEIYSADTLLTLSDFDLAFACCQLSGVRVSSTDRDVFGDAVEIFRSNWAKQVGGQFFTDQRITTLAMTLMEFDPLGGDDLVDICAGTGGFLLAGLKRIAQQAEGSGVSPVEPLVIETAERSLFGQEVDGSVAAVGNATLASRLGGAIKPVVDHGDSLRVGAFEEPAGRIAMGKHACAASNPPFGTKITVKDPAILRQFELARSPIPAGSFAIFAREAVTPRAPDVLFLERNLQILRPGGRLAIVLPYQILSGPQSLYIRDWLLRQARLLAVIDLPSESFQPHTGTKTTLLIAQKREVALDNAREAEDVPIFMGIPKWIGHDRRGSPIYKKKHDGSNSLELLSDFPEVEAAYSEFARGGDPARVHDGCFVTRTSAVSSDRLLRMNALFHRPVSRGGTGPQPEHPSWTSVRVGDVVSRIFYPGRFKRDYIEAQNGAVPFLGGSNITELIWATDKWLHPKDPKVALLQVRAGWLLVTRSGSTGIVSSVPDQWDGCAMSEHVIRIVPDADRLDPHYLQAALRTEYAKERLASGVFGSVIDEITPDHVAELRIPVPNDQLTLRRLAAKLGAAERARNTALKGFREAIEELNDSWREC